MLKLDRFLEVLFLCSGVLISIMVISVFYGVISRYLLRDPSIIAYEVAKMCVIGSLVFSIAYLERIGGHISIDLLLKRMPNPMQLLVTRLVAPSVGLVYTSAVTYKGFTSAVYSYKLGEKSQSVWAEPLWPVKACIPLGYGLLSVVLFVTILTFILKYGQWKRESSAL
ncbi:MAG: TRAP transporter small permease [Candidatus Bathyarchaeia archaeon]